MTGAPRILLAVAAAAALLMGAALVRQVVVASAQRLELDLVSDRLGGAIVDHAVRVRDGLPIYAEPDDHFVPVVYTPLYYHLAAAVMGFVPDGLRACRLTSLGLVVAAVGLLTWLVGSSTRSWWAAGLVPALAAAGYPACEFFYDAPRTDPAAALCIVGAVAVAAASSRWQSGFLIAPLLALAFWCKQSSLLFSAGFCTLLLADGKSGWRRALVAGSLCLVLIGISGSIVNGQTTGWFWRISIALSGEHELPWERLVATLKEDWLGPLLPALVGVGLALVSLPLLWRGQEADRRLRVLVFAAVAIALFTSVSRARTGGTQKVLIPLVLMLAALLPLAAWRAEQAVVRGGAKLALGLVARVGLAVILGLAWFPVAAALPPPAAVARWDDLMATVESYATRGQVWFAPWGWVTTRMPGQSMRPTLLALDDWLGVRGNSTGNPPPKQLVDALERQEFAAVFFPTTGKQRHLRRQLDAGYRLDMQLDPVNFGVEEREMELGVFVPKRRRER